MHQNDINKDLGNYLHERKKSDSVWHKLFGSSPRPKEEVEEDIKKDLEESSKDENLALQDKVELEKMEEKIVEVNKVEDDVEEEHEGLLKRFFKKLRFSRKNSEVRDEEDIDSEDVSEDEQEQSKESSDEEPKEQAIHHHTGSEEEMREFLKNLHHWITQLPPEKLSEFKHSKDFELYTKVLKKYDLIK